MLIWQQPWWLIGVPLSLLLVLFGRRPLQRAHQSEPLTLLHPSLLRVLPKLGERDSDNRREWLVPVALALFCVALAQPVWQGAWLKPAPLGREVVLLVDASKSMSIGDFALGGQPVDRLTVLKNLINRFVAARAGDQFGLVVFGDRAATLLPPTFDHELVQQMLARIPVGIAGENTALGEAIGLALKSINIRSPRRPALILFTDGDSTAGVVSPREATALAAEWKIPVYTIKVGTDLFGHAGRSAGEFGLADIATQSGGRYYTATSADLLADVIRDIGALERTVTPPSTQRELRALYWVPLACAGLLLFLARVGQARERAV